jgi:hypothetical protein
MSASNKESPNQLDQPLVADLRNPKLNTVEESEAKIREVIYMKHPLLSLTIPITVNGVTTSATIDSAAHVTVVSRNFVDQMGNAPALEEKVRLKEASETSFMEGSLVRDMPLEINGQKYKWDVIVAPISDDILLGMDFLVQHRVAMDLETKVVRIGNIDIKATLRHDGEFTTSVSRVVMARNSMIPPNSVKKVQVRPEHKLFPESSYVLEPSESGTEVVLLANRVEGAGYKPVNAYIHNGTERYIKLRKGHHMGFVSEIDQVCPGLEVEEGTSIESEPVFRVTQSATGCMDSTVPVLGSTERTTGSSELNERGVGKTPGPLLRRVEELDVGLTPDSLEGPLPEAEAGRSTSDGSGVSVPFHPKDPISDVEVDSISSGVVPAPIHSSVFEAKSAGDISSSVSEVISTVELEGLQQKLPQHVQDLFLRSCGDLTYYQSVQVGDLLKEFGDILAKHDLDLGCMVGVEHKINTGDEAPVRQKMRRTPLGFENEERQHLQKLLGVDVIQPSFSDWASAPVLVRKKDRSVRWCIDYRALNAKTVKDTFPLPNIDDCLDALAGTQYFSTLDLESGYYQILLAKEDRKKTAFRTRDGLYEHIRMGFGLCNAPATFQRAIQRVLMGLTWEEALAYLDDINVLGKSFEDELKNLREVFKRLRKYNLKLKPRKCFLFRTQCEFLGKLIDREGVHIAPGKIEAVKNWPVPKCKKDVESFLGFANYHRQHIRGFAGLTATLYDLTGSKKGATFEWQDRQQ